MIGLVFSRRDPEPAMWWVESEGGPVTVYFRDGDPFPPACVVFDDHGAARIPTTGSWTACQDGKKGVWANFRGYVVVHATAIPCLTPSFIVLDGGIEIGVSHLSALGQGAMAYVEFGPFAESWAEARHRYGLRGAP